MQSEMPLNEFVRQAITRYFIKLDGACCVNMYNLVLGEVERPLLEIVMQYADGNQSKAAKWLGLSRNTLRKLLHKYNLG